MRRLGSTIAGIVLLACGANAVAEEMPGPPETIWQYDTGG